MSHKPQKWLPAQFQYTKAFQEEMEPLFPGYLKRMGQAYQQQSHALHSD
jgi:hypothetical protein